MQGHLDDLATKNRADASTAFLRAARAGQIDKILALLGQDVDINVSNANGLNAIHLAAKDGHAAVLNELIARGASIDAATNKGNTALHIASLAGQEQVVKLLVQHGAQVNIQSQNGFTPLYMAAQENHDAVVKFLLANGANQTLATEDGFTPLAVAMQQGHERVVAVLLEADSRGRVRLPALHIAAKKDDVKAATLLLENEHNPDVTSKSGFTPLHIAAHYGNEAVARLLLARGADVNCTAKHNICPLHVAAKWGKEHMVCLLCERGACVDARTRDGLTPLHCAARSGHDRVVDALLERGAPIAGRSKNGLAPLHMAAQGDHAEAARALLTRRAPVDDLTVDYLTALHVAAHCGHVKVAKLLLDRNADANARALNGFTPLHIACKKNRMKVVELLLKYGAFISATTESGLTPLHVAAFMGCMSIVIYLLQHDAAPDAPTVRGETPLHLAARANQTDIIRILLRNGACVEARAREQHTPLHIGARLGNADIAALLLQHGAKAETQTADGYNALHIAAKQHNHDVAAVLLEHGAPVTATTKKGFTPLHLAAKYGNLKVANLLLKHGAPADVSGKNGVTPLHVAAQYDQQAVAGALMERGADAKAAAKNGHTPLHIAARKNQMETAGILLEHGADPAAQSRAGFQPLHLAAQQGHLEMCSLLLEAGAEPGGQARNGLSPLHLAAQEDRAPVAKLLLKNEAKVDARTKGGYTALHVASHFGQAAAARELLDNDAYVNSKTEYGYTALHHAAQQGHINIVNLLLDHKANPNETTNNGQTALDIASRLGYVTVLQRLKEARGECAAVAPSADRYKVVAPETMHETFMSDSEEEGGDDTLLTEQPYRYLTADDMKSLGDDSLPIDVTRDERADSAAGPNNIMEMSQGSTGPGFPSEDIVVKNVNHLYNNEHATEGYCYNVDTALPRKKLQWKSFMVSFLVDARGGAMRGSRGSGVKVVVPPLSAQQPTRITCRYLKPTRINNMPPLMEGEALASRVLEMGPVSAKFLGPVIIEVPHYAALRGGERELVILRSDNGCNWREHAADATGDLAHQILNDSLHIEDGGTAEESTNGAFNRTTRILTHDFPQYFAVISRIRQEVHAIGPEGGMVSSSVVPQVQAVFPQGALTKKIKVGLQAQTIESELTAKMLGRGVAVSPVVTVEPRRRKFHKAITLSMPAPRAHTHGMINNYAGSAPTLRLLCSISGGTNRAHWEDVTENTPLTFVGDCVSFTTTVSARYWLIDCRNVADAAKMATELYREAIHVPFIARFVVYARAKDARDAELRAFCVTDDREDKTLERLERFTQVAKSRDVEVHEGKSVYVELCGNLSCVSGGAGGGGERPALAFRAFRENRLSINAIRRSADDDAVARCRFLRDAKPPANGEPAPPPVCVLNIVIPDLTGDYSEHEESTASVDDAAWRQKLSDPGLWEVCRLLGRDWVPLAYELGLSAATVNQIQSKGGDASAHAALMLKLWRTQSGPKTQDNQLELALCCIGRDDIMLPSSEQETQRRIQRNVYQERQAEEDLSRAADTTDTNRLSAATDEMESIMETSLGADEAKYSPEEKALLDDRTPSPTEGSEDEGYERSVAERKEQIERKLSTTRVPSSKQKREIREEICEVKRHSRAPEILKLHESVAVDNTQYNVVQQVSIEQITIKKEFEDKTDINITQIMNEDISFVGEEPKQSEPSILKKFDPSAQKQTPKHLQKHARQDSMIRFSSGDFSDIKVTSRKGQSTEVSDITQQLLEKESEISSVTSDATCSKEIVTSVIIEKHDIEESSEGDKSPELVAEYTERDIAEAPLREKIDSFENKMQHSLNGDPSKVQTQVTLTKEALKKHTQDYEQTVEYTQEFVRDQSRQSVEKTEIVEEIFEASTKDTKAEEVVDTIQSVKEKIQRFDSRVRQETICHEEKSAKFAKAMRTDSTIVQVSSEEDAEFMKKSTESDTETESQTTVRIDKSLFIPKAPISVQNGLSDHKETLKHVEEQTRSDMAPDLSHYTRDNTDAESKQKLTEDLAQRSQLLAADSLGSDPLDSPAHGLSRDSPVQDQLGSDPLDSLRHGVSQDSPAPELTDSLRIDQDVSTTQTDSKIYSKDSKHGRSDSLDEASQFSELDEGQSSGASPAHRVADDVTSTNIRSQTSYFLELESQYSAQINAPKPSEQKISPKESPVISAKARQFIETVPEEDSVQECFFSKRIYSDSLEDSDHTDSRRHSEADSLKSDQSDLKLKISSDFDERAEFEENVDSGSGFGDEKFDESVGFTSTNVEPIEDFAPYNIGHTVILDGTEERSSTKVIVSENIENGTIFKKVGPPKRHSRTESVSMTQGFQEEISKATEASKSAVQECQIIVTEADDTIIDDRVSSFEKEDISDKISSESSREIEMRSSDGITSEDAVTEKKTSSDEEMLKYEDHIFSPETEYLDKQREGAVSPVESIHGSVKDLQKMDYKIQSLKNDLSSKNDLADKAVHGPAVAPSGDEKRHSVTSGGSIGALFPSEKRPSDAASLTESRDYTFDESEDSFGFDPSHDLKGKAKAIVEPIPEQSQDARCLQPAIARGDSLDDVEAVPEDHPPTRLMTHIHDIIQPLFEEELEKDNQEKYAFSPEDIKLPATEVKELGMPVSTSVSEYTPEAEDKMTKQSKETIGFQKAIEADVLKVERIDGEKMNVTENLQKIGQTFTPNSTLISETIAERENFEIFDKEKFTHSVKNEKFITGVEKMDSELHIDEVKNTSTDKNKVNVIEIKTSDFEKLIDESVSKKVENKDNTASGFQKSRELKISEHREVKTSEFAETDLTKGIITEIKTATSEKTFISGHSGMRDDFIKVGPIVEIKIDEAPDIVRGESLDEFIPLTDSKISETVSADLNKSVSETVDKSLIESKVYEKELDLETEILIQELIETGYVSKTENVEDVKITTKSGVVGDAKLDKDILNTKVEENEDSTLDAAYIDPKISKDTVSVDSIIEEAVIKVEEYLDAGKEEPLVERSSTSFGKSLAKDIQKDDGSKSVQARSFSVQSSPDDVEEKIYTDSESDMDRAKVLEIIEPPSDAELPLPFSSFDTKKIRTDSLDDADELFQEKEVEFLPEKDAYVTKQRTTTSTKSSSVSHSLEQHADSNVSYQRVIPPTIGIIRADSDVKEMSEHSDVTMKKNHVLEKRTSSELSKSTESVATVISMSAKSFEDDTKSILEEESQDTKTVCDIEESGKLKDISKARVSTDEDISKIKTVQVAKVNFEESSPISSTAVTVGSEHVEEYKKSGNAKVHTAEEFVEKLPLSSTLLETNAVETMHQKSFKSHEVVGKLTEKHEMSTEMGKTKHLVDEKEVYKSEVGNISKSIGIYREKLIDGKDVTTHHTSPSTKESLESKAPLSMTSETDDIQVTDASKVKVDEEMNIKSSDHCDNFTAKTDRGYVDLNKEQEISNTQLSTEMVQNQFKNVSKVEVNVDSKEKSEKKSSLSTEGSPEDDRDTILEDMKDLNRLDRRCSDLLEGISQQQGALVRIDTAYVIHDLSLKFSKTPPSSPVDLVAIEKASGKASGLQPKGPDSTSSLDTSVTVGRPSAGSPRDGVSRAHAPSSSSAGGGDSFMSDTDAMQSEMLTEASKVLTAAASPKSPTRHLADQLSFVNVDRPTVTSGAIELVDRTIAKSIDVIDQIKIEQLAAKQEKDKLLAEKKHQENTIHAIDEREKNVEKEEQLELNAKKEWLESGVRAQQLELDAKVATDMHKAVETNISTESKVSDTFKRSVSSKEIEVNEKIKNLESAQVVKLDEELDNLQLDDNMVESKSKEQSHQTFSPKREIEQYEFKYTSSIDDKQKTTSKDTYESVITVKQVSLTKVGETTKATEIDRYKMMKDVSELTDLKFKKIGKEIPYPSIQHRAPDGFSTILTHEETETHKISGQEFFSQTKHVSSSDDDSLIIKTETKHEIQGQEEQVKVKTTMRKDGDDMEFKTKKLEKAQEVTATRLDTETKAAFKGSDTSDIILVEREFQQQGLYSGRQTKSEEKMTALKDDLLIKSNELKYSERDLSHEQWGKEYFEESGLEDLKEHDDEDKSEHREAYESTTKIAEKDETSYSEEVSEKGKIVSSTTNYSKEESFLESKERDDLSSDISHETSFKSETAEKQDSMEKSDTSPKSRSKSFKKDNEVYEVGFITEIKVSSSPGKRISRAGSQDTQSESDISAESPVPPLDSKDFMTEIPSPIKQSKEQFQDHVWEASDQKPQSFEMALEFTQEIDESFQIKSAMTKSTDSSDTLIENKDLASKITDFGDLRIKISESSSVVEETGFRDIHSEKFDSSKDLMIKSGESMETEYMVKSLESHEGEALQKSMDSVSAEALHASEFSDSALHTTLTDPKREEIGRMIKEKSLEDICSSGYDTDLSSAEFHAAKLESDRGDSDVTRTPQRLADLSVLEKTIDEVKQSLEAAQGEIISEKSDGSSKYKQSPSEFEFKLISPDKPAVITEEPVQVGESTVISKAFENEVIKMMKAEKDLMTSSLDETTLSEAKETILEKERNSYTYDTSEPSMRSDSGPHSILETETEVVLSDIDDSSKGSPEVKLRPSHKQVKSRLFAGDRRSASEVEGWSSSGESHYQSFEHTESQHSSRPLSSDVENITTGQSTGDYETAQMTHDISSRSLKTSKDFYTAASSITSRDSMKSLDSDGSSHLASIDISDASETLVPSANELKEELMESGTFSDQFFHDDARRKNTLVLEESIELESLKEPTDELSDGEENQEKGYKLEESTSAESVSKMKRSHEMRFQQKEWSPEKSFLDSVPASVNTDDVSISNSKINKEECTIEPIITANKVSPSEEVITRKSLQSTEIITENKPTAVEATAVKDKSSEALCVTVPETEEQILAKLTNQIVWEGSQECEGMKPSKFLASNTSEEVIEKKQLLEAYTIDSKQSSSSSLKIQEHEPSAPHTPLSIPSQSSESTDNGREYVLDDMYEISETPELFYKDRTITDSKSELSVTTEEQTLFEASLYEKDQDSPTSDEFEIVDKPTEMDDFVVIEEVAKEAQETDMEGKSLHIAQVKYEKKHDEEVEEYLSKTSKKQDSEYSTSGSLSEEEMASYELEQKRLQAVELAEIEAGKKWVQMQFEGDARYEYERVPLEDIKEEEMADFDASRMGSLSSQKESIGSYGSFKNSFGSLSDSEMGSRRRFMVKGEQDDISISSLQEFENLEQALMEQYQQHSSSSQDSLNGSLPRRYLLSKNGQGDDISVSSLKEFEGLEKECIEALKLEIEAKKKEALLLSKDVKELSIGFLESERRSYSGGSSESSPPQKSDSPLLKSGSSSSGKSDSPGQKSPAQKYGSPSQKAIVESAIMKKLIDQQMALDAKVEQARRTPVKPGPTVITVQKKKFDERGAFFTTETQTQETACKEPDCIKQTSYECTDTKEQHRISDESLAGDCEEMMKMLEKQESERKHTDFETTETVEVVKTTMVTQKKYIDGKLISENVTTSSHSPKGVDIPGARTHEQIGESASYKSLEMESSRTLTSEMSTSATSQISNVDSIVTLLEQPYSLESGDSSSTNQTSIITVRRRPNSMELERTEHLDSGSSDNEVIIKEVLSPMSGRSSQTVISTSGKQLTDPASGSWSGQEEDMSSSGSFSRGGRCEIMLGSMDSLEASSSNATRATYNYEVDTPMTGSLTSGGSNTMVSSLDAMDPVTALYAEGSVHVEGNSYSDHGDNSHVQDSDTERQEIDSQAPRAKERTVMFDSTDTLSGGEAGREVDAVATFYIGDTPIVRGAERFDSSEDPEPSSAVLSGSAPASLPTLPVTPPVPAQRRSLTATSLAKSAMSEEDGVRKG